MESKKKKHEHHTKNKKSKKSKKRMGKKSSSESESDSDNMEWTEAKPQSKMSASKREEWMEDESFVPTYDSQRSDRRKAKQRKTEEERFHEKKILDARELNPHWKNNGSGLPTDAKETSATSVMVGDGGYSWLKKAYQRIKEQAEEGGQSMEDLAAPRWGSLAILEAKLNAAKEKFVATSGSSISDAKGDRNGRDRDKGRVERYSLKKPADADYSSENSREKDCRKRTNEDHNYRLTHHRDERNKYNSQYEEQNRTHNSQRDRYDSYKRPMDDDHLKDFSKTERHRSPDRYKSSLSKFKAPSDYESHDLPSSSKALASSSSHQASWKKNSSTKEVTASYQTSNAPTVSTLSSADSRVQSSSAIVAPSPSHSEMLSKVSSSSSSDSDSGPDEKSVPKERAILNKNELNYLAARVLRAKFNDEPELAAVIQEELVAAKARRQDFEESGERIHDGFIREDIIASEIDRFPLPKGFCRKNSRMKKDKYKNVYVTPMQTKHFGEDKDSIKDMFEQEKASTIDDQMKMYFAAASKDRESLNHECDADVSGKTAKKMDTYPSEEKDMQKFIHSYRKLDTALDKCHFCLDKPGLLKHTIITKGEKVFLCTPPYKSLVEGHCFIVPVTHVSSTLLLDENEYSEVDTFKRGLIKMFGDQGKCLVFMETSFKHSTYPHATIECIPMPKDTGEMAPLYFKKAIDESEYEWAQNKKLIDLSKKSVRKSVPKGLPFFCVEFGTNGGFAHIIEDEKRFPKYFGKEIVGGMLEIDSYDIVRDKTENWHDISKKVLKFVHLLEKYEYYFQC